MTEDTHADLRADLHADVVVVGGGTAGLAAAVALARSRRSVVVVDAGEPRNAPADGAHNVLGQEGISPLELLARGRAEAEGYGVRVVRGLVTGASGVVDDFRLEVDGADEGDGAVQRVTARRVILAAGLVDQLPDVPGVAEGWGHSVLHCPFCHGWEVRDQRIAVLGTTENALHQVMLFRQLSDDVTFFVHDAPEPTEEQWDQLAALGVRVVTPRVERLVVDGRQVQAVEVEGGRSFPMDAVVVAPRFVARTELYEALGGERTVTPFGEHVAPDPRGATAVPGVWVAGNTGDLMAMVVAAAASGVMAGAAVHGDLAVADLAKAVAERRAPFSAAMESEVHEAVLADRRHGV
ncbi:thioredoxin reductase [Sanguibacter keddieii DSM 10542]|uniref:Thioredoxin reductase n=1 Tax=Sanguibacter keddieii (strain ATCC 51767 / DSM 10542 / NCFB 3025 / ST-74) TaxID=446469 RepID=D1BJP7_SANKS|nr:NAD(P)/FAD-dependent oxidoreductase [Sanguibacter keddieii]ACZ20303.1 thioredoxin reductase [Sanguibacter keddieii DSM 10542]